MTSASTSSAFEDFDEELSQGELPGWVEAMRPVVESTDATGLSEDEDYIENYGPLAGIPSVLPAEAEIALDPDQVPRKPLDLIATKSQQDYVNVLKKLISDENKTKTIYKTCSGRNPAGLTLVHCNYYVSNHSCYRGFWWNNCRRPSHGGPSSKHRLWGLI